MDCSDKNKEVRKEKTSVSHDLERKEILELDAITQNIRRNPSSFHKTVNYLRRDRARRMIRKKRTRKDKTHNT